MLWFVFSHDSKDSMSNNRFIIGYIKPHSHTHTHTSSRARAHTHTHTHTHTLTHSHSLTQLVQLQCQTLSQLTATVMMIRMCVCLTIIYNDRNVTYAIVSFDICACLHSGLIEQILHIIRNLITHAT